MRHPRHEGDVYLTPPEFAAAGLKLVAIEPQLILDPGAGTGVWGQAARQRWPHAKIIGVEQRDLPKPAGYDLLCAPADFLELFPHLPPMDLVVMNPPFNQAEAFVRTGMALLRPRGELLAFLRLAFREGQGRARGLFAEFPLAELAVCDRRPRFYNGRTGQTAFAFYRWRHGHQGATKLTTAFIDDSES